MIQHIPPGPLVFHVVQWIDFFWENRSRKPELFSHLKIMGLSREIFPVKTNPLIRESKRSRCHSHLPLTAANGLLFGSL